MILPVLVYIFKRAISNGEWPSTWRISIMVPIFKGGVPGIMRVIG